MSQQSNLICSKSLSNSNRFLCAETTEIRLDRLLLCGNRSSSTHLQLSFDFLLLTASSQKKLKANLRHFHFFLSSLALFEANAILFAAQSSRQTGSAVDDYDRVLACFQPAQMCGLRVSTGSKLHLTENAFSMWLFGSPVVVAMVAPPCLSICSVSLSLSLSLLLGVSVF
jgi:hypothetical protein